jgi:uncharacterized repeat protein (TIGR01451 family)
MKVITRCVGAFLVCVTVALSAHAVPVTIDFQALEVPGNPSPTIINFNYVEEGYRFTGPSANRFGTGSRFYAGSTAIRVGSLGGQLRGDLTTVSGVPFDLLSLDLAEGNNGLSNVIVTGTFARGGTITQTLFTLSPLVTNDAAASFDTFVLTGFQNLASVSFTVVDNNAFRVAQLDNIVVDETPRADLAITKTDGVVTAVPGGSVAYTITASNAGPSNAPGATVADTFPASLSCTWTCVGAGGGTCTASGAGNINDTVNLPNGASTTYTASCAISAAATGTLANTATITAPNSVIDPTPGNNSATDTDMLTR